MDVGPGFDMHRNNVGAGFGKRLEIGIARCDHQMDIECLFGVRTDGANDVWADGNVGNKMAVHDIDMDPVGAGSIDGAHLLAEFCKIGGQD